MLEAELQDRPFWERHVEKFKTSGLSKSAYARQEGLVLGRCVYWSNKLIEPASGFLPVKLKAGSDSNLTLVTIESPQGWRFSIHDPSILTQLPKWLSALPQ